MSERGLPIADGAAACPFVAFEDDRDERATVPDHRHRCYADLRPSPRALAHQEAYCLSSSFPVCPTFQDWARRESARARANAHLDAVHAQANQVAGALLGRHVPGHQVDLRKLLLQPPHGLHDALGMPVRRVHEQHIHFGLHQFLGALHKIARHTERRAHA